MIRSKMRMGIFWAIVAMALQLWPGVVRPAHGQGSRKDDIVFNTRGVPLAGATVRVCAMPASGQPCTPLASIYSDAGLTQALANPTTTDGLGNYYFYAAPGKYEIEVSGPSITTKQIPNVILPSDPSSPTFSSISSTGGINAFSLTLTGNLTVNGSTSVVGNLASGTLTLSNQSTAPGAAGAGTVNLYTKTADKRLYYKDETGTEVGPIATASGAQTNQVNTFTATQNFDADVHPKGQNPWLDITRFGGYIGTNYGSNGTAATTCSINASSTSASCASASDFANGHGILILGAGPATAIATPQAPTVTPYFQTGSTTRSYCVADRDWAGGITPCSPAGTTTTAPASMNLATYSVASWSFNASTHTFTVTTSAVHNMPTTSSGIASEPYAQIEIQGGTTNSGYCEGAFSLTAVPSATTFQFTRNELVSDPGCTGGTMRIQPRITLSWDSRYTYSVQSATCSGGNATVTVSPGVFGPANTAAPNWVVPWFVKAIFSGVSDSHYNGSYVVGQYTPSGATPNAVQYSLGSCAGVSNVGAGGTMTLVPGKAVKNHLIYECTGSSCTLPANAANYSLVGVAIGNDGYFQDKGWGGFPTFTDTGDVPTTAPTTATNEYLDTTIVSGGGTTSLTLASAATNSVSGAKTFHDNTPNLLAACAALPQSGGGSNGGRIVIPTPSSIYNFFPIAGNFDTYGTFGGSTRNCPGYTTFEFHAPPFLLGTILLGKGNSIVGGPGSTNCSPGFYPAATEMTCIQGDSFPLVYFEPETSSSNFLQNVEFFPQGSYQTGLFLDEQLNGDGNVDERFENVHVNGGNHSYPVVDKGGFGRFWNFGGWSATNGSATFAEARDYLITFNCGMPSYLPPTPFIVYIFTANQTYSFGTFQLDTCGLSNGNFGGSFNQVLTENTAGPAFKFNTFGRGLSGTTFNYFSYADPTGGASTPYFDLVNATVGGSEFNYVGCANGYQPILQTSSANNAYSGITVKENQGACPGGIGALTYRFDNMGSNLGVMSGYSTQINPGSQVFSPMGPPANFQSATAVSGTGLAPGTYTYCILAIDPFGGVTAVYKPSCSTVTTTSGNQSVQLVMPVSFPVGATGVVILDLSTGQYVNYNGCASPQVSVPGSTITLTSTFEGCQYAWPYLTSAMINYVSSSNGIGGSKLQLNGEFLNAAPRSEQNIFLPGALTSTWTGSTWTLDRGVTVTRVQVQAKTAPAGCTTNAVVRLTDGTTPVNLTIAAAANDSGAISQNFASGAALTLSLQTAAAGCTTSPADANVTIQYRMQ